MPEMSDEVRKYIEEERSKGMFPETIWKTAQLRFGERYKLDEIEKYIAAFDSAIKEYIEALLIEWRDHETIQKDVGAKYGEHGLDILDKYKISSPPVKKPPVQKVERPKGMPTIDELKRYVLNKDADAVRKDIRDNYGLEFDEIAIHQLLVTTYSDKEIREMMKKHGFKGKVYPESIRRGVEEEFAKAYEKVAGISIEEKIPFVKKPAEVIQKSSVVKPVKAKKKEKKKSSRASGCLVALAGLMIGGLVFGYVLSTGRDEKNYDSYEYQITSSPNYEYNNLVVETSNLRRVELQTLLDEYKIRDILPRKASVVKGFSGEMTGDDKEDVVVLYEPYSSTAYLVVISDYWNVLSKADTYMSIRGEEWVEEDCVKGVFHAHTMLDSEEEKYKVILRNTNTNDDEKVEIIKIWKGKDLLCYEYVNGDWEKILTLDNWRPEHYIAVRDQDFEVKDINGDGTDEFKHWYKEYALHGEFSLYPEVLRCEIVDTYFRKGNGFRVSETIWWLDGSSEEREGYIKFDERWIWYKH